MAIHAHYEAVKAQGQNAQLVEAIKRMCGVPSGNGRCGGTAEESKPYSLTVPRSVIAQYFSEKTKKKEIAATVEKALAMYFSGHTEAI